MVNVFIAYRAVAIRRERSSEQPAVAGNGGTPVAHNARCAEISARPPLFTRDPESHTMRCHKRWIVTAAVLLLAHSAGGCVDNDQPLGPSSEARFNAQEEGPGGTIGSGHEPMTASTDTTGRGPGGTIGSGH